jgi:hypothetical protein
MGGTVDKRLVGWSARFREVEEGPGIQNIVVINWTQGSGVITPWVEREGSELRLSEFEQWFDGWEFEAFVKEDMSYSTTPDPVLAFFERRNP